MKFILFLIILAFIACFPYNGYLLDKLRRHYIAHHEEIIKCIKEEGSETLKKLITENKDIKFGRLNEGNKDFTEEDKEIFQNCRRKAVSYLKSFKKNF